DSYWKGKLNIIVLKDKIKNFDFNLLNNEINNIINSYYKSEIRTKFYKEAIDDYLKQYSLNAYNNVFNNSKIATLFESILSDLIVYSLSNNKAILNKVTSIYNNISIKRGDLVVLESDTFIILKSGDLIGFEAKTHYSSAPIKDLNSRIKTIRDLNGKNRFYLIFPLTKKDIDFLKKDNIKDIDLPDIFSNMKLTQFQSWRSFIKRIDEYKDIKVLGLDEIELILKKELTIKER
ncbi:hypothetical protein JXR93_08445, partial [bacterium]|nr:hypothetical protein [bacterium]